MILIKCFTKDINKIYIQTITAMILSLTLYTLCVVAQVKESIIQDIEFPTLENNLKLSNVLNENGYLYFRQEGNNKSQATFLKHNPANNWSFSFTMNLPKLKYPQTSAIYCWYTTNTFENGSIKTEEFDGFVAGIEFVGDIVELMIAIHENKNQKVIKDYFEYSVIDKLDKIQIKVIHTSKNMKIEIYDDKQNLIHDHLRLTDQKYFGTHREGGYITLSTSYVNIDKNDMFKVSQINLYDRDEIEGYDVNKHNSTSFNDHNFDKDEISYALANLEHFMRYANLMLGKPKGLTIAKGISNANEDTKKLKNLQAKLDESMKNLPIMETKQLHEALIKLEQEVRILQRKIFNIQIHTKEIKNTSARNTTILYYVFVSILFYIILTSFKDYKSSKKKYV